MKKETRKNIAIRIAAAVLMFCCIMWGYWWITWCVAILLLFYFPIYYEIILWGVIYDAMYGMALPEFFNIPYVFTGTSIILFLVAFFLKKRLIMYEHKE